MGSESLGQIIPRPLVPRVWSRRRRGIGFRWAHSHGPVNKIQGAPSKAQSSRQGSASSYLRTTLTYRADIPRSMHVLGMELLLIWATLGRML